jgi:hypothetical protein
MSVAWRCPCGKPGVVQTAPLLADDTPFPTTYYLTCPNAVKAISTLEGSGLMAQMSGRLSDPELAAQYTQAHLSYLADRQEIADGLGVEVPHIAGVSAGGMPDRVKCLHSLVGHSLAKGPGVNPFGDEAVDELGEFWSTPCLGYGIDSPDAVDVRESEFSEGRIS